MGNGWIKLHRKFTEWEWYDCPNMVAVFVHCLFKANYKDKNWRGKLIKRGQFVTGISKFSKEIGLSFQQVRTAWSKLEETGEITTKSTNKGTTVSVCNYDTYQGGDSVSNKQSNKRITNEQQTNNEQIITNKANNTERGDEVTSGSTNKKMTVSVCNYDTYQGGDSVSNKQSNKRITNEQQTDNKRITTTKKVNNTKKEKNKGAPPRKDDVEEYFSERGDMILNDIPREAENFINYYADRDWKNSSGKKIKSWKRQASTWNNKYLQYNEDRLNNVSSNGEAVNVEIMGLS